MTDEEIEQGFKDQPMNPQALGAYEIWVTAVRWAEDFAHKDSIRKASDLHANDCAHWGGEDLAAWLRLE